MVARRGAVLFATAVAMWVAGLSSSLPALACPWPAVASAGALCARMQSANGSQLRVGSLTIPLTHAFVLKGGLEELPPGSDSNVFEFLAPVSGPTLSTPGQPLAPIDLSNVVNPAFLSVAEDAKYATALGSAAKRAVTATVELAGPPGSVIWYPVEFLDQTGTALRLPVKIRLKNWFLKGTCYLGSNGTPIVLELTTGVSGALQGSPGTLHVNMPATILTLSGLSLVDETYTAPAALGCGRVTAGGADTAVDAKLGLPASSGANAATIDGTWKQAS